MKNIIIFMLFPIFLFSERSVEELLKEMQRAQNQINTLQAEFYQKKTSKLFKNPQELYGVIYFKKPDSIRWEYAGPEKYIILVEKETFQIYYPALKKLKTGKFSRLRGRIFSILFAQEPLEKLKNYFTLELRIKEKENVLILIPQMFRLKKYWQSWKMVIDKESFLPSAVEIVEKDGDITYIEFKNLKKDFPISEEIFKLEIPPDVIRENYTKSME